MSDIIIAPKGGAETRRRVAPPRVLLRRKSSQLAFVVARMRPAECRWSKRGHSKGMTRYYGRGWLAFRNRYRTNYLKPHPEFRGMLAQREKRIHRREPSFCAWANPLSFPDCAKSGQRKLAGSWTCTGRSHTVGETTKRCRSIRVHVHADPTNDPVHHHFR